jgi:hypothetical protein
MSPRWNWDSPNPSPASECALPPGQKGGGGGGAHSPAAKGVGKSLFRRLEKKRSTLPTLHVVFVWTRFKNVELSHERTREKRRCCFCTKQLWGARILCSVVCVRVICLI